MYYEHFRLNGAPFEFNPSASVLYMSAGHREGLAALEWGLSEPSGFTMLVGEIGAGKTTLIYSLLSSRHNGVRTAWVANPRISFEEMLRQILGQLGVNRSEKIGKLVLLQAFDAELAKLGPDECLAVIIDEAQDLSDDALEDLRLLSNFQSLERRRLQIVLVGQLDLATRLASPKLRQLNQRIGARALLPTLQGNEIYDYVDYRLRSKGGDIKTLFSQGALKELARASGGIPRRINVLCHNALFNAFAQGEPCVTAENMGDAAHDYDHLLVSKGSVSAKMAASASAAMQSASAAMLSTTGALRSAASSIRQKATPAESIRPAMRSGAATVVRALSAAATFAALALLGVAVAGLLEQQPVRNNLSTLAHRFASKAATKLRTPITPIVVERSPLQFMKSSPGAAGQAPNTIGLAPVNAHDRAAKTENQLIMRGRGDAPPTHASSIKVRPAPIEREPEASAAPSIVPVTLSRVTTFPARSPRSTVMVRAGDTLSKIAMRLYGSFEEDDVRDDVSRIRAANPQIKNANLIYPGQSIRVDRGSK
jgi:type II secretory pathway predicted ATPase ExeA/nucleoid-associated protein YgaU